MEHSVKDTILNMAAHLWSREERLRRGCTCGGTDIGVSVMHEPGCGDPGPEDVANLLVRAHKLALDAALSVTSNQIGTVRDGEYGAGFRSALELATHEIKQLR